MKKRSVKQQQILEYIIQHVSDHGYPPSVREIGDAVGLRSPSTVHFHLKALEEAGVIYKNTGKTRAITVNMQQVESPSFAIDSELTISPTKSQMQMKSVGLIPILGQVAAGLPILAQEQVEEYLPFDTGRSDPQSFFALRVCGESMINAGILPGDLVVVRKQQTAYHGEIVIARIGDEATVKRLFRKDNQIWLLPENDSFTPINGTNAEILGKVKAVIRNY